MTLSTSTVIETVKALNHYGESLKLAFHGNLFADFALPQTFANSTWEFPCD